MKVSQNISVVSSFLVRAYFVRESPSVKVYSSSNALCNMTHT